MEAEAPLELGMKFRVGQRDDARRRLRLLGPHDRRTMASGGIARQRQDRERPSGEKMLLGAAVVIALVRDGGDNGGLAVAPAMAGDARALADRRTRAVGSDQQTRGERVAIGQTHIGAVGGAVGRKLKIRDRRRRKRDAFVLRLRRQRRQQWAVLHQWANGSPGSTSPSKLRKTGRTASVRRLSVTTIPRMGCASTSCQTPMVSNRRRAAATMADARPSFAAPASAGSATVTENDGARLWRSAIASARPAKPAPPISTSTFCASRDGESIGESMGRLRPRL